MKRKFHFRIKDVFSKNKNIYLGCFDGVPIYKYDEYIVDYHGELSVKYNGKDLADFLQLRPDMFDCAKIVRIVK